MSKPDPKPTPTEKAGPQPLRRSTPMKRRSAMPRRSGPLSRSAAMESAAPKRSQDAEARGKRINAVNTKRRASESLRAYGPKARREWAVQRPCCVCGRHATPDRPNQQAHTQGGGTGRKADADTIAVLCHDCHRTHHQNGGNNATFEQALGLDAGHLARAAARLQAEWQRESGGEG